MSAFDYWVYVARYLNVILGAAYFGILLVICRHHWHHMDSAERWLFSSLLWLSGSTTCIVAFILADATPVSPQSFLQLAMTPFYILAHRSLNRVDRYRQ